MLSKSGLIHILKILDYNQEEQNAMLLDFEQFKAVKISLESASLFLLKKDDNAFYAMTVLYGYTPDFENIDQQTLFACLEKVTAYYLSYPITLSSVLSSDFCAKHQLLSFSADDIVFDSLNQGSSSDSDKTQNLKQQQLIVLRATLNLNHLNEKECVKAVDDLLELSVTLSKKFGSNI